MSARQKKRFTFDQILRRGDFGIKRTRTPQWLEDGSGWLYQDRVSEGRSQTLWKEDALTGENEPLFLPEKIRPEEIWKKVVFSHRKVYDDGKLIIFHERGRASRPTRSHGNVFLLDTERERVRQLTHTSKDQRNAKLSPDRRLMGVVRANDIYVLGLESEQERRLTDDGGDTTYNGRFGWVYEEELGLTDGFQFSPDNEWIAYWQVDERDVPVIGIQRYDTLNMNAPGMRYPKAGEPNPKVRIGVVSVRGGQTRWLDVNMDGDHYLVSLQWTDGGRLLIQRIPRVQNRIEVLVADPKSGEVQTVLDEEGPYWIDRQGDMKLLKNDRFLWRSDRDGFNHLYLYGLDGKLVRQVTKGDWEVSSLVGVDEEHQLVYFTAARPLPTQRQLFYAPLSGGAEVQLSEEPGVHAISMNPQATLYVDNRSSHETPPQSNLHRSSGKLIRNLVANERKGLDAYAFSEWEYGTFESEDGETLYYKMLKPAGFNTGERYPVYMTNYGGPGSQSVMDSWNLALYERHLTELGFIVFTVDNRGTGGRGREWRKITYLDLGKWETRDQAEGAKWLAKQPYVDGSRIAMYGWSYGGNMACNCILRYPELWKAAIAGAPVTDWRFYDTIYTERYMRTPQENPEGYESSSCLTYAKDLQNRLLIIHGTSDDNVHVQNSLRLAEELQRADKQFEMMLYPNQRHGVGMCKHMNRLMVDFLVRALKPGQ
ncbi:MAG: S9 family peptidase [Armatimonadetes bacterium]|nr:S9 family peptidase [Armatimonadota bacterium]